LPGRSARRPHACRRCASAFERFGEREELAHLLLLLLALGKERLHRARIAQRDLPARLEGHELRDPSQKRYGRSSTRPTSRTAAFAAIVPNVAICDTDSAPYFFFT
jgi:hypothetical protein